MPPKRLVLKKETTDQPPTTLAKEVEHAVKEWYSALGKPVPKEDQDWCTNYLEQEAKEFKELEQDTRHLIDEDAPPPPPPPPPKAAYGTPEFWKEYWAKKKAAGYVPKKDAAASSKKKSPPAS